MKMSIPSLSFDNANDWCNWLLNNGYVVGHCSSLYWIRHEKENLPLTGTLYYTHIQNYGEIIHELEVGEIAEN